MFENLRRGGQARNFTTNVPKILDFKSSSPNRYFPKIDVGCPCIFLRMSASSKNESCDNEAFFISCWNLPCAVRICTNCQYVKTVKVSMFLKICWPWSYIFLNSFRSYASSNWVLWCLKGMFLRTRKLFCSLERDSSGVKSMTVSWNTKISKIEMGMKLFDGWRWKKKQLHFARLTVRFLARWRLAV